MRRFLDALYLGSGYLAALFLLAIAVLVTAQIVGRLFSFLVPSADDFARLSLAASSFLALAFTLRRGGHIRVSLLLEHLPGSGRRAVEIVCLTMATAISGFFAVYAVDMVHDGIVFPDYTIGLISIPKWIPQIGMAIGIILMFIAFLDDLIAVLRGQPSSYDRAAAAAGEQGDRHAAHE